MIHSGQEDFWIFLAASGITLSMGLAAGVVAAASVNPQKMGYAMQLADEHGLCWEPQTHIVRLCLYVARVPRQR